MVDLTWLAKLTQHKKLTETLLKLVEMHKEKNLYMSWDAALQGVARVMYIYECTANAMAAGAGGVMAGGWDPKLSGSRFGWVRWNAGM